MTALTGLVASRLHELAARRFRASATAATLFFENEAGTVAEACLAMARRFARGGRLLVLSEGAETSDAQHIAVEFVHPVIMGKRALPALALASDVASLTGAARVAGPDDAFATLVQVLGRPADIVMAISRADLPERLASALARGRGRGMLTVAVIGRASRASECDFTFSVPSSDALVVQEIHETLYHVLWELVHVFFEHGVV